MKIMFICTGNTCRSPMAEKLLNKKAKEQNLKIQAKSCGVFAQNGEQATQNTITAMQEYGVDISKHKATNINDINLTEMDLILCMTKSNKLLTLQMHPELKSKIYTLKEYIEGKINDTDIIDPWGHELETYKKTAKELDKTIDELLTKIKNDI